MVKPRNVEGYFVQEIDGCRNCANRYNGMANIFGQFILSCSLACFNKEKPCWCDEVDPLGICLSYKKEEKL